MSRIVITSHGTLGDNLPLIALGEELLRCGHDLRMVLSPPMHAYALRCGLTTLSNGRTPLGQQEAQAQAWAWNHLHSERQGIDPDPIALLDELRGEMIEGVSCLLEACSNADLLLTSPLQQSVAGLVQESLGLTWAIASVTPSLHCQKQQVTNPRQASGSTTAFAARMQILHSEIRSSLGLPQLPQDELAATLETSHCILGSSAHFSQPAQAYSHAVQTGFWFYDDPVHRHWHPDSNLREFMERTPSPLVLSFSSLPLEDARAVIEVHVKAAAALGRPILIQQGWAGFNASQLPAECNPDQVMFQDYLPQDWLFTHAAALIHHGGIGTTARALRNGCPMLVEPYGNDQFFNARQVVLHGVGAAMHPGQLSVDGLARILEEKVLTTAYRNRACDLGAKIRSEQGLEVAAAAVEDLLQG